MLILVRAGVLLAGVLAPPAEQAVVPDKPRPSSYVLEWNAPATCPDPETVTHRIEELLGGAPGGDDGEMRVQARIEHKGREFTLALTTLFMGQTDERSPVTAPRCEDLSETVALTVALALEPAAFDRPSRVPTVPPTAAADNADSVSTPADPDVAPDRAEDPSRDPAVRATDPSELRRFEVVLRLSGALSYGALPRVGGGTLATVGLAWPRLRVELFGTYLWPQTNRSDSARFQSGGVGLRACGRPSVGIVEFPLCGGVEAGVIRADSRGFEPPSRLHPGLLTVLAGAGVAVRGKRIGFWSLLEPGVPVIRPRFLVGDTVVFRGAPVNLRLEAGIEFFF